MVRFSTTKAGRWMRLGIGRLDFDGRETMLLLFANHPWAQAQIRWFRSPFLGSDLR